MLKKLFLSIFYKIKNIFIFLPNIFPLIKKKQKEFTHDLRNLKYNLLNITETNLKLGIHHFKNKNFSDAIFRFKLVIYFLDKNNKEANYWLGWIYFLKHNYSLAIIHLKKAAGFEHQVDLLFFVENINNIGEVPDKIYQYHRNIMADLFINKFINTKQNIISYFINTLVSSITNVPKEYKILDLGANTGLVGAELKKRMPYFPSITGVEISEIMIQLQNIYFPQEKIYNQMICSSINDFFANSKNLYHVIVSLEGFHYTSNLALLFKNVLNHLEDGGYFAFCLRTSAEPTFLSQHLDFTYSVDATTNILKNLGYELLSIQEFSMEIKNNYSIFTCTKIMKVNNEI